MAAKILTRVPFFITGIARGEADRKSLLPKGLQKMEKNNPHPAEPRTSQTLLLGLKQPGSSEHWRRFVEQYEPMMRRWAQRKGLADEVARDVISEVYVKLVEHLPKFVYDPDQRFRGWLRRTLDHAIIDQYRRGQATRTLTNQELDLHLASHGVSALDEHDEILDDLTKRLQTANRLVQLVRKRVNPKTWRAFFRTEVDGVPGVDVARELGISEGAIYTARFRVRAILQEEIHKHAVEGMS